MITKIGITAGKIWTHLDENGCVDAPNLCEHLEVSWSIVFMSLGWLAREGYVVLEEKEEKRYQVRLRTKNTAIQ